MKQKKIVSRVVSLIFLMSVLGMGSLFAQKASPASDFKYDLNEAGDGIVIQAYLGKGGDVVIPSKIEDMPVVGLKLQMIHNFNFAPITSLIFPDSVTFIEFAEGESESIANKKLKKLVLPKNLKIIGDSLFAGAVNLTELVLPENLEEIGYTSFIEIGSDTKTGIKSIVFPKKLKKIGFRAFYMCNNIQSITIPESVEYIGEAAFGWCKNLVSVTMPKKQIEYDGDAFNNCPKLTLKERKKIKDTGYTGKF
ncbi:leucine-rich repeat domain-containing protein [Treponema sp. OMZ 787]|uniref:leucine-rich repeat domain-containing protein n=1 Tax=Treponema sp. OMZ 787 TaxID=2563669 RepID=UPI0020A5FDB2|nr:leucine-rich repeat domain-containing protein [Treponema sp. OMZ 787]UTC63463.1 leucine-rich repeat domain-containing protein [Treponema sp. OMZ 787]